MPSQTSVDAVIIAGERKRCKIIEESSQIPDSGWGWRFGFNFENKIYRCKVYLQRI